MPLSRIGRTVLAGAGAALLMGTALSPALAGFRATATTVVNVRQGPGPQYVVIGVIDNNQPAIVNGCLQGSNWCQVSYNGTTGWVYSDYLVTDMTGQPMVIAELPPSTSVPTVTYETNGDQATNFTVGAAGGAVTGALVGGPVGAAVGGVVGAGIGVAATPPDTVRTYVIDHPVDPVYMNGQVVVGTRLPQTVQLQPVPDYRYDYAYLNGQPVLIDPQTRAIVHVY